MNHIFLKKKYLYIDTNKDQEIKHITSNSLKCKLKRFFFPALIWMICCNGIITLNRICCINAMLSIIYLSIYKYIIYLQNNSFVRIYHFYSFIFYSCFCHSEREREENKKRNRKQTRSRELYIPPCENVIG